MNERLYGLAVLGARTDRAGARCLRNCRAPSEPTCGLPLRRRCHPRVAIKAAQRPSARTAILLCIKGGKDDD
jgi:hypothetical protein